MPASDCTLKLQDALLLALRQRVAACPAHRLPVSRAAGLWWCKGLDSKPKPQLRQGTRRAAQGVPAEEAAKDEAVAGQAPKPAPPKPPPAAPAARDAPAALPALAERCSMCLHRMALPVAI